MTAASTLPSSSSRTASGIAIARELRFGQEGEVTLRQIVELQRLLAPLAAELGWIADVAVCEVGVDVEEPLLLGVAALAHVGRVERAHRRAAAEVVDHVQLRHDRRRAVAE